MATVDKNFRIKNGLVVEGTTATVNGNDIVTTGSSTTNLPEGTNLYFTDERAQDAFGAMLGGGTQTNITVTYDDASGTVSFVAENGVGDSTTDDLSEGASNLYFTDERAQDAIGAMLGGTQTNITVAYDDASGTLSFVAEPTVADSTTDDLTEGSTNLYFTDARALSATSSAYDAAGSAATAESNANANTDSLIGDGTVDGTAGNTVTDRISTAVSNLVDSAPAALDTLNELAAALGDDENFATTISTSIGEKVAKAGDTMTGELALPSISLNSVAKSVAASGLVATAGAATAISFAKASHKSAEFLVKASYGAHTEVSKVLLTLDSSDNISITEYGIVSTNGSLITVTADISVDDVRLRVTTANDNTTVTVAGTLLI